MRTPIDHIDEQDGSSLIGSFDREEHPPTYTDSLPSSEVRTGQEVPQPRNTVVHPLDPAASFDITQTRTKGTSTGNVKTVMSHLLTNNPSALNKYMANEARTLPVPYVHIQGSDCDIKVPLTNLLHPSWHMTKVTDKDMLAYRGSSLRDEESGNSPMSLPEDWYRDACKPSWRPKIFTLTHRVTGMDENFLINKLHELLEDAEALYFANNNHKPRPRFPRHLRKLCSRTPKYTIRICLEHRATVLYSEHWLNHLRLDRRTWWTILLFHLCLVAWPLLHLITKQWDCVRVDWLVRVFWKEGDDINGEAGGWPLMDGDTERSGGRVGRLGGHDGLVVEDGSVMLAGVSEMEWLEWMGKVIVDAVESGRKGWVRGLE
ncbi:MAG: hypothetical protein Q9217_006641 [Psora testacea]